MKIGSLEINVFADSSSATIEKHYNASVSKKIDLDANEIYALEFAVKEIKRQLNMD